MRKLLFALLFAATSPAAFAAAKPPEVEQSIKSEAPVGQATLRKLLLNVYDATLWSDASPFAMNKPLALTLKYRMNFAADEIIDRSIDEMNHAQKLSAEQEASYRTILSKAIPAVKEGDRITALYNGANSILFSHNGTATHSVSNRAFATAFLGIWLAPTTTEPELREKLIGNATE